MISGVIENIFRLWRPKFTMNQFADAVIREDATSAQGMLNARAPTRNIFSFYFFCDKSKEAPPVRLEFKDKKIDVGFNIDGSAAWRREAAVQLFSAIDLLVYCRGISTGVIGFHTIDFACGPGLAFCSNRSDNTLVSDHCFVGYRGYQWLRDAFSKNPVPWDARRPIAFWRGSTTGLPRDVTADLRAIDRNADHPFPLSGWRSLERIALCRYTKNNSIFDVGISNIAQIFDPLCEAELRSEGLMKEFSPPQELQLYKYHIDIDGNVNTFAGLYFKLLSGSPVLKIESSRGFRQWYYDRLLPFENYVPVKSDLSDLLERVEWLRDHDLEAKRIGEAGRALALSMTFKTEAERARKAIIEHTA
ncbi:MAG TPA: glycosyl transferase family 90 [Methylocystis sp.]